MSFPDPKPWSEGELENLKIATDGIEKSFDDQVGQRLAALRFEINACDSFQGHGVSEAAEFLAGLREEYTALATVIRNVEQAVGGLMANKRETVEGVGTLERHRDTSRRNWSHEDLLRVVLDSDRRPKGGSGDGEVESDLDVLRAVYGLRGYNARSTALRERGIDPDEYSEHEDRGWRVSIK